MPCAHHPPASVYPVSKALQEGCPSTPVPAHIPAAIVQSPHTICHTNPSLTAYPFFSLCAPARHKSAGKQQEVEEHTNPCRDKGGRAQALPGLEPRQEESPSGNLGLDLVSEHLTGSEQKRTQAPLPW